MTPHEPATVIKRALLTRFGEAFEVPADLSGLPELAILASRGTQRVYADRAVDPALLRLLCACALSAPSKSDLQQADLLVVADPVLRGEIASLVPDQHWVRAAPVFLLVLANGRRLVEISRLRAKPFPNRHLDHFFNATADAAIVLATFLRAAEAVGLGCCPVSVVREQAAGISDLVGLPPLVVPVAGLCVGWPTRAPVISPRLDLACTLHRDRYDEGDLADRVAGYDRRRAVSQPFATQRDVLRWGDAASYGWSEDKARQFADPHCAGFGTFVRGKGYCLD